MIPSPFDREDGFPKITGEAADGSLLWARCEEEGCQRDAVVRYGGAVLCMEHAVDRIAERDERGVGEPDQTIPGPVPTVPTCEHGFIGPCSECDGSGQEPEEAQEPAEVGING